jgi:hypothetical protein
LAFCKRSIELALGEAVDYGVSLKSDHPTYKGGLQYPAVSAEIELKIISIPVNDHDQEQND